MPFTVTKTLGSSSAFAARIAEVARPQATRLLNDVGREAVRRADAIVSREFNNARSEERRRPGGKLLGSFTSSTTRGSGRVLAVVTLSSNAPEVKLKSLNYGSNPHQIGADGRRLTFPTSNSIPGASGRGFPIHRSPNLLKRRKRNQAGAVATVRGPVNHPGTEGSQFMERAMEQAVQSVLRKSVKLSRR